MGTTQASLWSVIEAEPHEWELDDTTKRSGRRGVARARWALEHPDDEAGQGEDDQREQQRAEHLRGEREEEAACES